MATTALACVPPVCPISAAGGKSQHHLVNQCGAKLAFKVKCSNNSNYTVKPVFGVVGVGEKVAMEITRSNGKPKGDKLVILFAEVTDTMTPAEAASAFQPGFQSSLTGEVVVKLSAAE
uniref:MSP domain-containing protein n=1 Tax=Steinernema glaseri TaxID=37863 RepID=A0A1I7ZDC2_9BILA